TRSPTTCPSKSRSLDQRGAFFDRLSMRTFLCATKSQPHPEPVEGRTVEMHAYRHAVARLHAPPATPAMTLLSALASGPPLRPPLRHRLRRRGVAAAAAAHLAVDDDHADAGDVALLDAVEQVLAGRVLGLVHDDEVGGAAGLDDPAVEFTLPGRVAGGEAEGDLRLDVAEGREHGDHPQDAGRLPARARRRVRPQYHAVELLQLVGGVERVERGRLVAVVDDLDRARAFLAERADLVDRQRGVAAVDVADDVGVGLQHHVLVDQAGAGDRRAAGVDRALDAVLARPRHHLPGFPAALDAAEADLAQELHARLGQLLEVALDHALLDHRRARMHFDAAGVEGVEGALRRDGERLHADDVLR